MLKKTYVADCLRDGKVRGSGWVRVWFWKTPAYAHDILANRAQSHGYDIVQFRRVR